MTSKFSALGISADIVRAIEDMGWTEPTPIQIEAVPCGLEGRDMLAQAQTGTGKTGAFGSIIIDSISTGRGRAKALILTPTRELALQVTEEMEKLSKYTGHRCVPVYGGVNMARQTQALEKGTEIIVATPGRLVDHLKDDDRLLADVSVVVLDEADRMLDMGFRKELDYILERVPEERQTLLFSATMSEDVRKMAMKHLIDPEEISVSGDEPVLDLIDQYYMNVMKDDKIETLRYILAKEPMRTIVFCFTKYRVDKVVRKLKMSFRLAGIHGDISQNRREEILRKFKEGKIDVLVASDLAARGLDIENVGRIINLDMPPEPETYVHRIGRTGRAGKRGNALSFVMPEEKRLLKDIENYTLIPIEKVATPDAEEIEDVCSQIRELEHPVIFKKNSRPNDVPVSEKVFVLAEMNIGTGDKLGKAAISQLLRDYTEVPKKSVGDIRPGEKTTALEIESKYLQAAIDGMSKCTVNGRTVRVRKIADIEKPVPEKKEQAPEKKAPVKKGYADRRSADNGRSGQRRPEGGRDRRREDNRSGSKNGGRGQGRPEGRSGRREGEHSGPRGGRPRSGRDSGQKKRY